MKLTRLLLCATIGALFSLPLQAQEIDSTSITVLLRSTITSLESNKKLPENTATALAQLEQTAPRLEAIFPVPVTYSEEDIAAMERHNLTRYYNVDTSDKTADAVHEMLTKLKNNPLVESVQITPVIAKDELISVLPVAKTDVKKMIAGQNGFPDYTSFQHYKHGLIPEAGYKIGGVNSIAARAYSGGDGEYARVISTEWSHWSYTHVDLPQPFMVHDETGFSTPDQHDTRSAGIMFSKDNGFGTTGIVPKAQAGYSQFSRLGGRSLFRLGKFLQPGDVVQVGIQVHAPLPIPMDVCDNEDRNYCFLPVEAARSVADEISYLTQEKGVHVIIAAANGNINLDHPYFEGHYDRNKYDSGAIYAGAADPTNGMRADYSESGSRVDLFSWGWNVTTTNCDGVYCAEDKYTDSYGGTSAANPIIAGAVAQVQSIAFAHGLGAILPKKMRQVLVQTGHPLPFPDPQRPIGMQPDVDAAVKFLLSEDKPIEETRPPTVVVSGPTQAAAGNSVTLDASGSSADNGGTLSYSWKVLPHLEFNTSGAQLTFTAPALTHDVTYVFTVTANDGKLGSQKNHSVLVKADGAPPTPPVEECKPLWKQGTAYQVGDLVQHKGRIYEAMWTTSREPGDPAYTDTIDQGWGFEWTDKGACSK
ncbi:S8 family serine peptidase [Glaciimonas immobilis]|uniref:Chitodextrinase n=1 Tax=Glaciimonas immobilis TaxID=728004 RepID=A0A840RY83_9BURK|nr:S8 family serine peptidase [Glaciimonas immobilis]KAF3998720.1 S8 family serine peptidase [Glaciimonas immobilis]MBB5201604.1 chitodextrinase [Glaciimonas immobilis]